jgi:parvulin-like peptidyl-prolyl isomerase
MPGLRTAPSRALAAVAVLALVLAGCSSDSASALTVNGKDVSQSTVDGDYSAMLKNAALKSQLAQTGGQLPPEVKAAWLTALVETQVAQTAVKQAGTKITKNDRVAAEQWADQFFGSQEIVAAFPKSFRTAVLERYANVPAYVRTHTKAPTDADALANYQSSLAKSCASRRFISHILVATEDEAKSLEAQLAAGGSFAQLAQASSTDKQSGANGGVLGCIDSQQPDATFAAAAAALAIGQVSQPVKTQYGWHIIKVEDVQQALPFETVKKEILRDLVEHGQEGQRQLIKLMAKAKVKVASRFGRWVVKDGNGRVEPPKSATTSTSAPVGGAPTSTTPPTSAP